MGEYALRKSDGHSIKIGTCEDMYYLRYEDRNAVQATKNNCDPANETGLRFRLPYPDEDNVLPGEYQEYDRGVRLFIMVPDHMDREYAMDYAPAWLTTDAEPGSIQFTHESGLLFSVPCHHGVKLPEAEGIRFHWNGKSHSIELCQVKVMDDGEVLPVVRCRHCGHKWRDRWENVLPYVHDEVLRERLAGHVKH